MTEKFTFETLVAGISDGSHLKQSAYISYHKLRTRSGWDFRCRNSLPENTSKFCVIISPVYCSIFHAAFDTSLGTVTEAGSFSTGV